MPQLFKGGMRNEIATPHSDHDQRIKRKKNRKNTFAQVETKVSDAVPAGLVSGASSRPAPQSPHQPLQGDNLTESKNTALRA